MNVNPSSSQFCDVKPWDSLTDAERASGDWIQLPATDGAASQARRRSVFESLPIKQYKPERYASKLAGAPGHER